jgi:F-type H+-transporting ATPase subunit b
MLGIDIKILIGQILNFAILFFVLKKFAFPYFFKILENRRKKIEEGVRKEEIARRKLEEIKELSKRVQLKSQKKAREIIEQAKKIAEKEREKILRETEEKKERILKETQEMLEIEKEKMKTKAKDEILQTTFVILEKVLREKIDPQKDKEILKKIFEKV